MRVAPISRSSEDRQNRGAIVAAAILAVLQSSVLFARSDEVETILMDRSSVGRGREARDAGQAPVTGSRTIVLRRSGATRRGSDR